MSFVLDFLRGKTLGLLGLCNFVDESKYILFLQCNVQFIIIIIYIYLHYITYNLVMPITSRVNFDAPVAEGKIENKNENVTGDDEANVFPMQK